MSNPTTGGMVAYEIAVANARFFLGVIAITPEQLFRGCSSPAQKTSI
ncbi:MAG: hypothetical protein ACXV7G_08355 [Halobacteriota archaeon]